MAEQIPLGGGMCVGRRPVGGFGQLLHADAQAVPSSFRAAAKAAIALDRPTLPFCIYFSSHVHMPHLTSYSTLHTLLTDFLLLCTMLSANRHISTSYCNIFVLLSQSEHGISVKTPNDLKDCPCSLLYFIMTLPPVKIAGGKAHFIHDELQITIPVAANG